MKGKHYVFRELERDATAEIKQQSTQQSTILGTARAAKATVATAGAATAVVATTAATARERAGQRREWERERV